MGLSLQVADVFRPLKTLVVALGEGSWAAWHGAEPVSICQQHGRGRGAPPPSSVSPPAPPSLPLLLPSPWGSPPANAVGLHV